MQTRLSRICDAIIEAGWLAVLVVTPLFFNTLTSRVFEPDKIHLLRSIVLVMAVAWAVQWLDVGRQRDASQPGFLQCIRRTPLVLPALLLTAAYVLSTILSIAPRISLLGSYVRGQGLYTFLCYVTLFFVMLTHLRTRDQLRRLSYVVVVTSFPVALYAVIQHYGLDTLPWGGDVQQRAASTLGNAIFLAAYLIMAFFVTLERLVASTVKLLKSEAGHAADFVRIGIYLFVLVMQLVAIFFTQSRGPWLGLAAGVYVFALLGVWLAGRWAVEHPGAPAWLRAGSRPLVLGLIGLTGVAVIFVIVANLPQGPLAGLRDRPYIGRIATMMDTSAGTNAVRVLIWEGVADMMLSPHAPLSQPGGRPDALNVIRPLVGYGPESMWVAFNRFYPPALAYYEARNASPDRSHNETFDALTRTGFLGLVAQFYLFVSIFYYALRWLGLIRTRSRRNLFFALLAGGALLGVIIPRVTDGSLRLTGIGLPAGLMAGLILYITLDVILSPAASAAPSEERTEEELRRVGALSAGQRDLLILAAFSAIVSFFVEIHFGIAISSTLAMFWVLAALLVVVGMEWIGDVTPNATGAVAPVVAAQPAPTVKANVPSGKRGKKAERAERAASTARQQAVSSSPPGNAPPSDAFRAFLPFAASMSIVTLVLTWNFLVNQVNSQGSFAILWDAFTARIDRTTFEVIRSPFILLLVIATWLVGGALALTESAQLSPAGRRRWGLTAAVYLAATAGVFVVYGLMQAARMGAAGLAGLDVIRRVAAHIVFFDIMLFLLILALAAALRLADPRPRPARFTAGSPIIPLVGGVVLSVLALLLIYRVNIRTIQADTFYKQGIAYEQAGSWDGAIVLYREAAALQPREDFYDLFLGRALLQLTSQAQAGGEVRLPENVAGLSVAQLLAVVDQGIRSLSREDVYRAANAALTAARTSNPLNTDHSANLARLYRAWAFEGAVAPGQSAGNDVLHGLVQNQPDRVNMDRLKEAQRYYEEAVTLSPQNAQLYNELATVQYILGDNAGALATLDRSLALDPRYGQSYLLRGDALAASGDPEGALDAYRRAAEIAPGDLNTQSAIGVLSAQLGRTDEAVEVFGRIIASDAADLAAAETELARLGAEADAAGGYDKLPMAARERRDFLAGQIAALRSQLHLTHRNVALVYRDAKQTDQAVLAAQEALRYANDAQRPAIESLISDLQSGGSE